MCISVDFGWREEMIRELLHPIKGPTSSTPWLFWIPATASRNASNFKGSSSPSQSAGQESDAVTLNLWCCPPCLLCFRGDGGHFDLISPVLFEGACWSSSSSSMQCWGSHCQRSHCHQSFLIGYQKRPRGYNFLRVFCSQSFSPKSDRSTTLLFLSLAGPGAQGG